jgi:hypothetical protein
METQSRKVNYTEIENKTMIISRGTGEKNEKCRQTIQNNRYEGGLRPDI